MKKLRGWSIRYSALNSQRKYNVVPSFQTEILLFIPFAFFGPTFSQYTLNMDPTPASNGPVIAGYFVNW